MAEDKKEVHISGSTEKQVIQPIVYGNLNMQSEGAKLSRWLTPIPSFEETLIGRDKDLKQLAQMIEKSRNVALINGMGGIGKTTLAIAYVDQYKDQYDHIAWIDQLEDFASSIAGATELLESLGITSLSGQPDQDAKSVLKQLAGIKGKCLLVIDNGEQDLIPYKPYLPKDWHVLITSREELGFQATYTLDFLDEQDAIKLFYTHCSYSQQDDLIKEIVQTVDYHTLSIELLAKTAAKKRGSLPLEQLWERIKDTGVNLGKQVQLRTTHSRQQQIEKIFPYLCAIFQVDKLSGQENWLLKQFACLPPTFHPFIDLADWLKKEEEQDLEDLEDGLTKLKTKGWLVYEEEKHSFKMHRIIQEVVIAQLNIQAGPVKQLVTTLTYLLRFDTTINPMYQFPWIPFARQILIVLEHQKTANIARLMNNLGTIYEKQGKYQLAEAVYLKALKIREEILNPNDHNLAASYNNIAIIYRLQGTYELALDYQLKNIKIAEELLKSNDPNLAITYDNLGQIYHSQGKYELAFEYYQKALKIKEEVLKPNDPSLGISYNNIAMVYHRQGKKELALEFYQKALKIYEKILDPNHPELATTYDNLAQLYLVQKKYKKALDFFKKAIKIREEVLGFEHPNLGRSYNNIAVVYENQKKYKLARSYYEKSQQIKRASLKEDHPDFQSTRRSLKRLLKKMN